MGYWGNHVSPLLSPGLMKIAVCVMHGQLLITLHGQLSHYKSLSPPDALWGWIQIFPFLLLGKSVSGSWQREARNPVSRRLCKAHCWWGCLWHCCVMLLWDVGIGGHVLWSQPPGLSTLFCPQRQKILLFWMISQFLLQPLFHRLNNTGDQSLWGTV